MIEPKAIPIVHEDRSAIAAVPQNPTSLVEKLFWIDGRISRTAYIMLSLLQIVVTIIAFWVSLALLQVSDVVVFGLLVMLGVALFWSILAVTTKRYHDVDASGWWQLLGVVPVLGWLIPIYLAVKPGTDGPNRFGPQP